MAKKILICDDSNSMRQMVKFTLTSAGYTVTEASDGMAGFQSAKLQQFDLVITDLNMPNLTGLQLTSQLRTLPNYKTTPILLLTTEHTDEKKAQGRAAGATGWLVKPFEPKGLLDVVAKVIGK